MNNTKLEEQELIEQIVELFKRQGKENWSMEDIFSALNQLGWYLIHP